MIGRNASVSPGIVRSRCGLPLMGWIEGHGDGTFTPLKAEQAGAIWCHFLNVREAVADPFEEIGPIVEVVAWEDCRPSVWWMLKRHKLTPRVVIVGEWIIANSWRDRMPARMLATPAEFIRSTDNPGFLVLDWSMPDTIIETIGEIEIEYSNPWLANTLVQARIARDFPNPAPLPKPEISDVAA